MRALPNMTVIEPADNEECRQAVLAMGDHQGPCYLRVARDVLPAIFDGSHKFQVGRGVALRRGGDVTLVASGRMVTEALRAAIELEQEGIGAAVIDMSTIKPLDVDLLVASARVTGAVVTAENASIIGGLGGAVAEALGENCPVPLVRVGVRDVYGESGPDDALTAKYGLGAPDIVAAARTAIRRKRR